MCRRLMLLVVGAVCVVGVVGVSPASAAESAWWKLSVSSLPTVLAPGSEEARVVVQASNLGDGPVRGDLSPVIVKVNLPSWLEATKIRGIAGPAEVGSGSPGGLLGKMSCPAVAPGQHQFTCEFSELLPAFGTLEMLVTVKVDGEPPASGVAQASVEGGETPGVSAPQTLSTGASNTFGVSDYELALEGEGGAADTQAGSHPFQLTSTVALNVAAGGGDEPFSPEATKDVNVKLPPGLVGNANLLPQCGEQQFAAFVEGGVANLCPADTAVGVALTTIDEPHTLRFKTYPTPIFNLAPNPGEPARFGWIVEGAPVVLDTSVRTGSDYGITVSVSKISQLVAFVKSEVTFWGVPGAAQHDASRGWSCVAGKLFSSILGAAPEEECDQHEIAPKAFLTLPTSCAGALSSGVEVDSWEHPGVFTEPPPYTLRNAAGEPSSLDGCNRLAFSPSISVAPDGQAASTPTGLTVGVHVPQEGSLLGEGLAEAEVKDTTVTLPAGVQLSPSSSDGLQACSDAQIGYRGENPETHVQEFTPSEQSCPDASKVATVKIKTPLLPNPLEGAVYLAAPQNFAGLPENPFRSLVAMYLVAKDPVSGVLIKLPGQVTPNSVTGQITATFENTPQQAFEQLELHFFGGARAPLATPAHCGDYETTSSITPWSEGTVTPSSSFEVTSGPNGTACPGQALPFAPTLTAGTTSNNAGNFSPLETTITREDGQQNISSVQLKMPPGLSGILSGVKLCGEAEGNAGTCSPASLIGSTIVSVGLGGDPFSVTGGKVYLTEKIAGSAADAPFGLSIVNPASAGPFVLDEGRPVIVRAQIEVNPATAALTVTTNSAAQGYAIPQILDGIPLEIKHVNVTIERPGFTFNPTNCSKLEVTGSVASAEGASSPVSVPFQATNCTALKFAPKFSVSTSGKTSKAKGASLTATLSEPAGSQGTQANITRVKVDLPKQLPSRLTTLQKACTAKQFEANPAACPKESMIGMAKVTTPLLPVPLVGPAIFVSHGGEAFPSLTMVLQGYGVTVDLVGTTFISKAGITSTTFKTVPDVPFNAFTLTLPQGKFSALAANGNLCKSQLAMPTEFLAQNGAKINESTKVSVASCPKAKKAAKKHKSKKQGKGKSKGGKKK
jgi:hypothetical protein